MALILNHLRAKHGLTRAMLAASTGLTRATVSSLVGELISLKLVRESGLQQSQGGRPGTSLELDPAGGSAIGIEIRIGSVSAILTDFVGRVLWRKLIDVDTRDASEVIAFAESLVDEAARRSEELDLKLLGIGLGLPGFVKIDEGILKSAPNLGWCDIEFEARWKTRYGVPVQVINEATAGALGEYYFGIAADYHDFIYLSTSLIGLGAGIMIDGKLFQGVTGYAGEVGHMVLDPSGPLCSCGQHGCWEKVGGVSQALQYVWDQAAEGRVSSVLSRTISNPCGLTIDCVAQAADDGDPVACEAIERIRAMFRIGITNLINIFNPQLVVIGGALSPLLEPVLPLLEPNDKLAFRMLTESVEIKISRLGEDACVMGAIASVLDVIFTDPSLSSD